ncbi:hypothetical protein ACYSNW_04780 [Enterococcus sp. LJL99]
MNELNIPIKKSYFVINLTDEDTNESKTALRFYYDDERLKNFRNEFESLNKKLEDIAKEAEKESDQFDATEAILEEYFENVFQKGDYEKIKKVQPVQIYRRNLIIETSEMIGTAVEELSIKQSEKEAAFYLVEK